MVRAKFKCVQITKTESGDQIKFQPVIGDSPENKEFFKYTPSGSVEIGTVNTEAAKQFEVGKEFFVDFTLAN